MYNPQIAQSEVHTYLVGIQYENPYDDYCSFFEIQRRVTLTELAEEVGDFLTNGKPSFPAFPPESNPEIWYAFDIDSNTEDDGDVLDLLTKEIENLLLKKAA